MGGPKPRVFVTRLIPREGIALLEKDFIVSVNKEDRVLSKKEIIEGVKGCDALLPLLTDSIDAEIMDAAPKLKIIANYAVGFNNIDVKEATKRGIPVTNTPGVLTETTADCAFAMLMAAARRIVEGDALCRRKEFRGWGPMFLLGQDVYGKTLGIAGMGRIGTAVARRASKGFGMKIIYDDTSRNTEADKEFGAKLVDKETLLRESDFLSIHVPLNDSTKHWLGAEELKKMKPSAVLINTSRGPVVDEKALAKALKEGRIFAAALDVFEFEPAIAEELLSLKNVVLCPHIASASVQTRTLMAVMAAKNIVAFFKGQTPPNIVNPETLKPGPRKK